MYTVRWYVMNAHGYIGKSQIERFRALMRTSNDTVAPNYRDIQSNANNVYACIEDSQRTDITNEILANDDIETGKDGLDAFWDKNSMAIIAIGGGFLLLALIIGLVIVCNNVTKNEDRERIPNNDEMDGVVDDELEIEVEDDNQQLIS